MIEVTIPKLASHVAALKNTDPKKEFKDPMEWSAQRLKDAARENVPTASRRLQGSIDFVIKDGGMIAHIGPGVRAGVIPEHALPVETGTRDGYVAPRGRLIVWALVKGLPIATAIAAVRAIFRRGLPSPQQQNQPPVYLERAWNDNRQAVEERFGKVGQKVAAEIIRRWDGGTV